VETLEQLYKRTREKHVATIRRILRGNHSAAEDVLQDAFIRALTYYHSFNPKKGKLENWFARILFNELGNYLRREKATKCESIERFWFLEDGVDYPFLIENMLVVKQAISKIEDEPTRRALYMVYVRGYLLKEVAETLHMNISTVKKIASSFKLVIKEEDDG
jgi:RNA polymerase sigma-70 factor (ECF subfamily)